MKSARSTLLKIIVQESPACVKLLRYLDRNVGNINKMGVRVRIETISSDDLDTDMSQRLSDRGINRLPALIMPDGKLFIGITPIIKLFEKNLSSAASSARIAAPRPEDYSEYMMGMMYSRDDNGKTVKITGDDDDGMGEGGGDISAKLAAYSRGIPKHRDPSITAGGGRVAATAPTSTNRPARRRHEPEPDDEYNDRYEATPQQQDNLLDAAVGGGDEAAIDRQMFEAMMNNI